MALNLLNAGHRVIVHNRTLGKRKRWPSRAHKSPPGLPMLPRRCSHHDAERDAAVEDVVFGEGGALYALGRNATHISMSTISIALSDRLAEAHAKGRPGLRRRAGVRTAGGSRGCQAIHHRGWRGGSARPLPRCSMSGQKHSWSALGPSMRCGSQRQFLIASVLESLGEPSRLVRKSGIDLAALFGILTGTLFSAPVYRTYGESRRRERSAMDLKHRLRSKTCASACWQQTQDRTDAGREPDPRSLIEPLPREEMPTGRAGGGLPREDRAVIERQGARHAILQSFIPPAIARLRLRARASRSAGGR